MKYSSQDKDIQRISEYCRIPSTGCGGVTPEENYIIVCSLYYKFFYNHARTRQCNDEIDQLINIMLEFDDTKSTHSVAELLTQVGNLITMETIVSLGIVSGRLSIKPNDMNTWSELPEGPFIIDNDKTDKFIMINDMVYIINKTAG